MFCHLLLISQTRSGLVLMVALFLATLAGCGESRLKTYAVTGRLVYEDGTFPQFGEVEFFNEQHQINARGKVEKDGTFKLTTFVPGDGAVAGNHKVVVMQHLSDPLIARAQADINHDHGKLIGLQYYDYRTSDLSCQVVADSPNEITLTVKPNPRQTADGMPLETAK